MQISAKTVYMLDDLFRAFVDVGYSAYDAVAKVKECTLS
jgi:hypothetical protein